MVKKLVITGGKPLNGEVTISGAKNAVTKMMIASILTEEPVVLYNAPHIGDVEITSEICRQIGTKLDLNNHVMNLETPIIEKTKVKELTSKNRISVLALGPLLHRSGEAELPIVSGDKIGARPVNYHLEALRQMGAEIKETKDGYSARARSLRGTQVELPYPSVGATENILLAAVLAKGRTVIGNAATEPEVIDLIMLLQRMGAIIEFRANRQLIIDGVSRLHGASYYVMPDRLEAASYGVLALATSGKIYVRNALQTDLVTFLNTVRRLGGDYLIDNEGISFSRGGEPLKSVVVKTDVWPSFSSDWQQPLAVLLTQCAGKSIIHETVYENRFEYIKDLNRMGARISVFDARKTLGLGKEFEGTHYNQSAAIIGPTPLHATELNIPDIRAGMAHVIAALTAKGESSLNGIEHLIRGYDEVLDKLRSVGARFTTV